jgi:glucokinase
MPIPVVLGIDFGGSKVAASVADVDGTRLATSTNGVQPAETARQTFAAAVADAHRLLADAVPDADLLAVGACTFGLPREDGIDLAPNIAGWEAIAFGAELRRAFPGAEVRTATDVKAAAQAELEQGALAGCDPGLYVNLGTGLAVAIASGGAVLAGRHGASGEIGYNLRHPADHHDGVRLEHAVSGKALAAAAYDLYGSADVGLLFERAASDRRAARVCSEFLAELCFHLVNLAIAIDPERVVVGGGMVRSWDLVRPTLAGALASAVPFPPELVLAEHPFDAPLIGAIALGAAAARDVLATRDVVTEGASA